MELNQKITRRHFNRVCGAHGGHESVRVLVGKLLLLLGEFGYRNGVQTTHENQAIKYEQKECCESVLLVLRVLAEELHKVIGNG